METFKEPGRGEKADDHRLPHDEINKLLEKYRPHGLTEDGEFFVIETDGTKTHFHKWKKIPAGGTNIEEYIRNHLGPERLKKVGEGHEDRAA